jgi:hypothetical protein
MADIISTQKDKIEQKKARLQQQETLLKLKERKARVRHLIEVGGLMAKAKMDHLPSDALLGALLSLRDTLEKDGAVVENWRKVGEKIFKEEVKHRSPIILKLATKPEQAIRNKIRSHNLKWNAIRQEWSGLVQDLPQLKQDLEGIKFDIEVLNI